MKNKFVDFKVLATSLCCSVVMGLISFAFLKCLDYAGKYKCQRCKSLWHFFTVICTLNNNVVAH